MNKKLLLIPIIILLIISFASADDYTNVTSYFTFDINGTANDDLSANDFTIDGSPVWNATGKIGGDYNLDGTDDLFYKTTPSFNNDQSGTLSWWQYFNSTSGDTFPINYMVGGAVGDEWRVRLYTTNIRFETINLGTNVILMTPVDSLPFDQEFHHIVITSDGTLLRIYIDSVLQSLTPVSGTNQGQWFGDATADTFVIGALKRASPICVPITIDELYISSRNSTQTDVDGLYAGGVGNQYPFNFTAEGNSTIVSEEYTTPQTENTSSTFNLLINWSGHNYTSSVVRFYYDSTEYVPTLIGSSYDVNGSLNYSINITTPYPEFNNTPYSFYWIYNLTNGGGINASNTSTKQQYLYWAFPRLNITARNIFSNTTLSNLSGYSDKLKLTNFNTSSSNYLLKLLEGTGDYDLYVIADNYGTDNITNYKTFVLNDTNITIHDITFFLYTNNSINLNIYDIITSGLINSSSSVSLTSENATYNYITENGTLYADYLNDGIYNIVVDNALYSLYSSFVTVADSSHQIVNAYLSTETNAVKFITQDTLGTAISNVSVVIYYTINGSPTVIASGYTDIFGQFQANLRADLTYYIIASHIDFDTFSGNMQPIDTSYTIIMTEAGSSYTNVFSDINFITQLVASSDNDNATLKYVINSGSGGLSYWGLNFSYINTTWLAVPHKTVFVSFNSTSVAGGNYYYNITNIIGSGLDNFSVLFWFKPVSGDVVIWNETYYVNNLNISDFTLTGGLFDDLEALDNNNALKGLFGALIIILGVIIFGLSKNMTISVVGGLVGVAINFMFGLLPSNLLIVSAIVGLILLIADNIRGIR